MEPRVLVLLACAVYGAQLAPDEMRADDLLPAEPQEVSVHDLLSLGDSKDDTASEGDMADIRAIYQSAAAKQHARDVAKLRSLVKGALNHRCWCSTKTKLKSAAEIEEEEESAKLAHVQAEAQQAADEARRELTKEKQEKAKTKAEERAGSQRLGEGGAELGCGSCRDKKTALTLKVRAAQIQAEELAQRVKRLRSELAK